MQLSTSAPGRTSGNPRDEFLLKLDKDTDLPAMGSSVSQVVQLASSDDNAVQDLTYFILSDVALTQKILRLANTVQYRLPAGGKISTISRAIFLLGFETIKTTALTMLLVERLSNLPHSHAVIAELKRAMCASVIGREMARSSRRPGAEEAAIAALFANVGQLMVAAYDYPHYMEIQELMKGGQISEEQAAIRVLGYGYASLSQSILRSWNIPESIAYAISPLPAGMLKPAKNIQEWVQQIASFSVEATQLVSVRSEKKLRQTEDKLIARYGAALSLDAEKLAELKQTVETEIAALSKVTYLAGMDEEHADDAADEGVQEIPAQFLMKQDEEPGGTPLTERYPSGKPIHSRELLMEGVQQIMQMSAATQPKINDILLLVLETLFNSMGFRFAAICLKDQATHEVRARLALGENLRQRKEGFKFIAVGRKGLFNLAMQSDADLMISDASDSKIQELLPEWHRRLLPDARSFMVLPIIAGQKPLGLFYGDRALPAPEGVASDETALVKILKTQLLTALSSR